ncbi:hypothetical protein OSTOST_23753 [Ostertagia ostertagi]
MAALSCSASVTNAAICVDDYQDFDLRISWAVSEFSNRPGSPISSCKGRRYWNCAEYLGYRAHLIALLPSTTLSAIYAHHICSLTLECSSFSPFGLLRLPYLASLKR